MPSYVRVILGKKNGSADEYKRAGFIGADFGIDVDLAKDLEHEREKFTKKYRSIYRKAHPGKGKIAAGLACNLYGRSVPNCSSGTLCLLRRATVPITLELFRVHMFTTQQVSYRTNGR